MLREFELRRFSSHLEGVYWWYTCFRLKIRSSATIGNILILKKDLDSLENLLLGGAPSTVSCDFSRPKTGSKRKKKWSQSETYENTLLWYHGYTFQEFEWVLFS